jgi:hypothetical protein
MKTIEKMPAAYLEVFELIEKAGGVDCAYDNNSLLTTKERNKVLINFWAFFFTIFFYIKHGMWRRGVNLLLIAILFCLAIFFIIYGLLGIQEQSSINMAVNVGSGAIFGYYANGDLYNRYILNQKKWW